MTALPQLSELTVSEKLQMMESLWDILCQQPKTFPLPSGTAKYWSNGKMPYARDLTTFRLGIRPKRISANASAKE
jgi:hypothetical protein